MAKAEYKGRYTYSGYQGIRTAVLIYEYRGRQYEVVDNPWDEFHPLWQQHKDAQQKIDEALDAAPKPKKELKPEDTAEYGINKFMEYCETGEWTE